MPKPGRYAKTRRPVRPQRRQGRVHHQRATIVGSQLSDFLLVRYALTTRHQLPRPARESGQRFLQELTDRLPARGGFVDLQAVLAEILATVNARVPWQFFWQLSANWDQLRSFLMRELPAIPLPQRLRVSPLPSQRKFDQQLASLLARRAARATTLKAALPATMIDQLSAGIETELVKDGQLRWDRVDQLLSPYGFPLAADLDPGTRAWLDQLRHYQFPGK